MRTVKKPNRVIPAKAGILNANGCYTPGVTALVLLYDFWGTFSKKVSRLFQYFLFSKESKTKKIVVSQNAHCSRRLDASAVAFKECETTAYDLSIHFNRLKCV